MNAEKGRKLDAILKRRQAEKRAMKGIMDPEALMTALEKMRQGYHDGDNQFEHEAVIKILDQAHKDINSGDDKKNLRWPPDPPPSPPGQKHG